MPIHPEGIKSTLIAVGDFKGKQEPALALMVGKSAEAVLDIADKRFNILVRMLLLIIDQCVFYIQEKCIIFFVLPEIDCLF